MTDQTNCEAAKSRSGSILRNGEFLLLAVFALYGAFLLYRMSFVVEGVRYFWLLDDQMISMTYAKHLVEGKGLVWSAGGASVEGFSNPLWMAVMAGLHLLPLSGAKMGLALQVISLALLGINLVVVMRLSAQLAPESSFAKFAPALLTATYLSLNYWSLGGFEVALLTPLVSATVLVTVSEMRRGVYTATPFILAGLATLVRLDMVVLCMALTVHRVVFCRRAGVRSVIIGGGVILVILAVQFWWRLLTFGEWLPNTYYLKMTGYPSALRVARGAFVLFEFLQRSLFIPLVVFAALGIKRHRRESALLLLVVGGFFSYSVYVGGDAWEWYGLANRFIVQVIPLVFILLALAGGELARLLPTGKRVKEGLGWALVLFLAVIFNLTGSSETDFSWVSAGGLFERSGHKQQVELAAMVKAATTPQAAIALTWAGTVPYLVDRDYIDMLGKNDPYIARLPMHSYESVGELIPSSTSKYNHFYPGHLKWDYRHSIQKVRPDMVIGNWYGLEEVSGFLMDNYHLLRRGRRVIFALRGSDNIRWEALSALGWDR